MLRSFALCFAIGSGLLAQHRDVDGSVAVLTELAARGTHETVAPLLVQARDASPAVRASRVFRAAFAGALDRALGSDARSVLELERCLVDLPVDLAPLVCESLRVLGRDDGLNCIGRMVGKGAPVDAAIARALGAWSPFSAARTDGRCVAPLVVFLEHEAPAVRRAAVEALNRHSGGGALDELALALVDEDPLTSAAAARVLARLTGRNWTERAAEWALWTARERTFEANRGEALRVALESAAPFEALEAVREIETHARRPNWRASALEAALGHSEVNVALAAAAALARLGDVRSVPALLGAAEDPRPVVATAARAALAALTGTPTPDSNWRPKP